MNRREMLLGSVAMASAAMVGSAHAATHDHDMHMHHDHAAPNAGLAAAASDCVQKGEVCLSHCLILLGDGDKDMAGCAKAVNQMLAICSALQNLVNQNSKHVSRMAAIAMDACKQCEEECKKHADKHAECKACGESCAACYKECKKVAAV
jgi:Cys-rich four helix bundle protein (predicted Tat secretion target)